MNYYAFHIGDYAVHTRHLSLMEDLAYRRLLDWYYIHERAIPAETQSVCRLIGMRDHAAEIDAVLHEFFTPNAAGEWTHTRCDAEIEKARAHADRARKNGSKGGRPSGNAPPTGAPTPPQQPPAPAKTQPVKSGGPKKSDSKAPIPNPIPIPKDKHTKPRAAAASAGTGFARFWAAWPASTRKAARLQCWQKWKDRGLDAMTDEIVAHVEAMKLTEDWRREGGRYIPAPLVYLNQDRYEAPTEAQTVAAAEAVNWRDSWKTVSKKGVEMGVGDWSINLWEAGKRPAYPAYLAKVEAAVAAVEKAEA